MFIFTAKLAKEKLIIGILGIAAVAALAVLLIGGGGDEKTTETISTTGITGNDDRLGYIASLGWSVEETPMETIEVVVPQEDDPVFERYNQLQESQGFDLGRLSGKKVKKITYKVLNHPSGQDDVLLTIYTYKKEIVGGDVSLPGEDGFMHGLQMPQTWEKTADNSQATTTETLS